MIRRGTLDDLPAIVSIFETARAYMRQTGNLTQWADGYPTQEIIRADIAAGECFVMEENGVHAVFTLLSAPDPTYAYIEDGAWPHNKPYGTLHRVASDGKLRGVVQKAVDFALERHSVLRCDTHKDNLPMQRALMGAGFIRCGIIYLEDGATREAFQRG